MDYLEFNLRVSPLHPWRDVLISELGEVGFESFDETENGVLAYVQTELYDEASFNKMLILSNDLCQIKYKKNNVKPHNWNEEWEKNFNPIIVDDRCVIRAPFHNKTDANYEIIIEPKMSFGTGHHETTHLMTQYILDANLKDMSVMDMGCGTGILAILAAMKGASNIDAIDIDEWSFENSVENAKRNNVDFINVSQGDANSIKGENIYDLFIANINRNILVNDMQHYAKSIKPGGNLLLSGFYENDVDILVTEAKKYNFKLIEKRERNSWAALKLEKK